LPSVIIFSPILGFAFYSVGRVAEGQPGGHLERNAETRVGGPCHIDANELFYLLVVMVQHIQKRLARFIATSKTKFDGIGGDTFIVQLHVVVAIDRKRLVE
jgi:hypothetical protein